MARRSFENVWDAIEKTRKARMKMRSNLLLAIEQKVRGWNVTQGVAARRLGITQPRLNDILRGKSAKFCIDTLIALAGKADLKVQMQIKNIAKAA
jgi:predicted XRE-type DNA-binding protein